MTPARRCCFCLSLQLGCIVIFLFGLFFSVVHIDYVYSLINRNDRMGKKFAGKVILSFLQMTPYLLSFVSAFLLFFSILSQYSCLFWTTLVFQAIDALYLLIFSIITSSMGLNIIINEDMTHNILYWAYVILWIVLTAYFMYITYSYYRKLKAQQDERDAV
ncbi:uncharacterized protein [Drosophila bipectinata]|uniref:uncharacterized protein n=1 Tax=Drosophila bipectinata TaxID=42026 RepID=UPI0038B25BE3